MLEPRGKWSRYIGCLPGRVSEQMVEFTGKTKDRIEAHIVKEKKEKKKDLVLATWIIPLMSHFRSNGAASA